MKKTDWKKAITIYFALEYRTRKLVNFPIRGCSAKEIADYLLQEHSENLTTIQKDVLQEILRK